jgi:hypothetical protein
METQTDKMFVTEIIINFDQIVTFTTTGMWNFYIENAQQTMPAFKLKVESYNTYLWYWRVSL